MIDKKISRRDFLRTGVLSILALIISSVNKHINYRSETSYKEAKHYKRLAG